jgi:hypothetical protein
MLAFILISTGLFSCLEKYDFHVNKTGDGLVVEASISDISFKETQSFPSDGRYFEVRLSKTSDVDNRRDEKISKAKIQLLSNKGEAYNYSSSGKEDGLYFLKTEDFAAKSGEEYSMQITLATGEVFESAWESLPDGENEIGEVFYEEEIKEQYVFEAEEKVIRPITGINVQLKLPDNSYSANQYTRWSFEPLWTYSAAMLAEDNPFKYCWATSPYYLKDFVLGKFKKGGFNQELFFIKTKGNWRLYDYFSVLVHQEKMTPDFFQFWTDFQAQGEKGGLYDQPPFGLATNFTSINSEWTVNGYFGVIDENTVRWEFDPSKLSYTIQDDLYQFCLENGQNDPRLPPGQCYDCRAHTLGDAVNLPPIWWKKEIGI